MPESRSSSQLPLPRILVLAEDGGTFFRLLRQVLASHGHLIVVESIASTSLAQEYLAAQSSRTLPHLIIINVSLHTGGGLQLVRWLSEHPRLNIPTMVLAPHYDTDHANQCLALGVDVYAEAPITIGALELLVGDIRQLLGSVVDLDEPRAS